VEYGAPVTPYFVEYGALLYGKEALGNAQLGCRFSRACYV